MTEHIIEIAERLRELREISGYSVEDVAKKISVSIDEYEQYESGVVDIPVSVLYAAAPCFGVSMTEILTGDKAKLHTYCLVKKDKMMDLEQSDHYAYKELANGYAKRKIEPLLVFVKPADDIANVTPNHHEGHEFHYCLEGKYEIQIAEHKLIVEEGDSLYFNSGLPHAMRGLDNKIAKLLVIVA